MRKPTRFQSLMGIVLCAGAAFAAETATWTNSVANTPDTAYSWSDPGNWSNGYVGGTDASDLVTITPSAKVYIRVPDGGVTIRKLLGGANGANATLLGGSITFIGNKSDSARAELSSAASVYCNLIAAKDEPYSHPYLSGNFVLCDTWDARHTSMRPVISDGSNHWRFDRFATAPGESRTEVAVSGNGDFGLGSGSLTFYGPVGADAVSGIWRIKSGSPYAYRVSPTAHPLAVGTIVTSAGNLPGGTFLKRVFDDSTIELSEPAEADGEVTLDFAAFTPNFTAKFAGNYYQQGNYGYYFCYKTREQDVVRVEFKTFYGSAGAIPLEVGAASDSTVVGTFVFHSVPMNGSDKLYKYFNVRHAHIELAGAGDTGITEFSDRCPWTQRENLTTTVTVTNNITGIVPVFTNFHGTIVKNGGGLLRIGLGEASNAGSFVVEGGTLQVCRAGTAGSGAILLNGLTVRSGATFAIPEGETAVDDLVLEPGATITGNGELRAINPNGFLHGELNGVVCTGGAKIRLASGESDVGDLQLSAPEARVAGHPAFWVDASKPETITTNSTGGVLRWNDCRAGEPMFCTNVASAYPTYVTTGLKPYVKIGRVNTAETLEATQMLVWSEPIDGIKAVFLVQDPSDGGGEILGRTSSRCPNSCYGSQGGPYIRGPGSYANPLSGPSYTTPCVVNGRYYLDGVEVNGLTKGYNGSFMQLVEHHVNTNFWARPSVRKELVCDAFGTGYMQPHNDLKYKFGMRVAEYIIYTNSLTYTERLQTAQYLMKKWLGRSVSYSVVDTNAVADVSGSSVTMDVAAGKAQVAARLASGSLVKIGGGTMYVNGASADSLKVAEGELIVASGGRDTEVPQDAWLHMDADDASTITKAAGTDKLSIWNDAAGSGRSLRPTRSASANVIKVEEDSINGRTAIDIGEFAPRGNGTSDGLIMYRADGTLVSEDVNGGLGAKYTPPVMQTMFFVYDSSAGGGPIFGGVGSDWPGKGLPHHYNAGDNDTPIFYANSYFTTIKYDISTLSNELTVGNATFRRNGQQIHPFEEKFLKGVERVTFQYNTGYRQGRCGDTFGTYGNSYSTGDYCGGLKYGEIILYPRMLSPSEVARVEAYLARKWSGIETPGYGAAKASTLSVASGATLTVLGLPFETVALSGGGTVDGDVKLAASGGITVNVAAGGSVECLTVTGAADLSGGGTVTLAGSVPALQAGMYRIMAADTLSFGGAWTVAGGLKSNTYALSVSGNALYLTVAPHGLKFILR